MCGRFVIIPDNLKARFDIWGNVLELSPNYNAAPSQLLPAVIFDGSQNQIELMEWGLIPSWSKQRQTGYSMFNARIETLLEKPTYSRPFKTQRCIIPANGFYEWKKTENGKQPYYITQTGEVTMGFAGIYDIWEDVANGNRIKSYTIITTESKGIMKEIHDRSPVILRRSHETEWLQSSDEQGLISLLQDNVTNLSLQPVSKLVNLVRNNDKSLIEPIVL
jgi:putative SOS response-associated peptidase YedK